MGTKKEIRSQNRCACQVSKASRRRNCRSLEVFAKSTCDAPTTPRSPQCQGISVAIKLYEVMILCAHAYEGKIHCWIFIGFDLWAQVFWHFDMSEEPEDAHVSDLERKCQMSMLVISWLEHQKPWLCWGCFRQTRYGCKADDQITNLAFIAFA